jgi:hypothetical protein
MRIPVAGSDLESILRGAEILSKHWIKNERTTLYLTSDGKYCCVVESTGLSTAQGIVMFTAMLGQRPPAKAGGFRRPNLMKNRMP